VPEGWEFGGDLSGLWSAVLAVLRSGVEGSEMPWPEEQGLCSPYKAGLGMQCQLFC
jgi:hypothetical protein